MGFRETCVVLLLLQHTGVALEISAPNKHQATVGSPALITCSYTVQKPPVDPKFFAAFWCLEGKQILSYDDEVITTDPRYSLDIEKALNGRVDLSISKTAFSDAGVYACSVRYSPMEKTKEITVYVTAPPQVTITNKTVVLNEESVLRCSVTGFYPMDIGIKWFRGREMLGDVTVDEPRRNSDGSYSVNSTATITPTEEDREQNFSCRVQHESLKKPLQEDFQLLYRVYRAPPQVTITNKTVVLNEESVLRCSVTGFYPMDIGIKWFRGREMLGDVTVDEPRRNSDGSYSVNSTATITPTEEDREQNFSCRVQHESLKKPLQEDFQLLYRVYRDNVMLDYQSLLIAVVSGITAAAVGILVIILATALYCNKQKRICNQHPADEQSRDDHDMGAEQASSTTAARVTPTSTLTLHANVRTPQTQALQGTLPDLEIGEINVPELIKDKTATLTCRLYNYILGVHTVEWFEEGPERGEQRAVNDSRRLRTIDEQSEDERIYRANLTLTPVTRADNEITYICRVKTSNAQKTIEKRTERLHVKETPKKRTTEERRTEGGERPLLVNESIHEEKQKTSAELETDLLGEHDNQDCTPVPKNGKSKGLCPAKELSGEEWDEERPLPTNKPCDEEETDHLEESSTREDEELKEEKKENKETSQVINNTLIEQETDESKETSTGEEINEKEEENEETSQVINKPLNEKLAEQKETSEEVRRENSGGLCPAGESPQEDNEETSLLSNEEKRRAGLRERSPHEMEIKSSDGLCVANQLSEEEDDDETKPLNNTILNKQ